MRFLLLLLVVLLSCRSYSQKPGKLLISGIVLSKDSVPLSGVAIVNIRTGKVMRTNTSGFFKVEIAPEDSLLVYHLAYKNKFIRAKDNYHYIFLEPDIREVMQVDVFDKKSKDQQHLDQTMGDILRLAPMQKISAYDMKSVAQHFVDQQGSHNKGFSPFFGPTVDVSLRKLVSPITKRKERLEREKLTSHYHLEKKGKTK